MLSLVPIMVGVAAASAAELSFNWYGFISAMISNLTFGGSFCDGLSVFVRACVCMVGGCVWGCVGGVNWCGFFSAMIST